MITQQCSARVHGAGGGRFAHRMRPCSKPATLEEGGAWYCATHAPSKVAARRAMAHEKAVAANEYRGRQAVRRGRAADIVRAALAWEASGQTQTAELILAVDAYRAAGGTGYD